MKKKRDPRSESLGLYAAHPRFWGDWLWLSLTWLMSKLPFDLALRCGDGIGMLFYWLARERRHIAATNLRLCFPELSEAQRAQMLRENMRNTGRGLVETALAWWAPDGVFEGRGRFHGWENMERARASGRGVLMLCGHFTSLEVGGRLLTQRMSFDPVYRPHKSPVVEYFTHEARKGRAGNAIPRDDVRGLVRALRKGNVVFYLPDQDYGRKHSVFAPFFGIQAATVTAVSRIARMSGCAVLPLFYTIRSVR